VSFFRIPSPPEGGAERAKKGRTVRIDHLDFQIKEMIYDTYGSCAICITHITHVLSIILYFPSLNDRSKSSKMISCV
jgi:peptide deformylase